MGAVHPSDRQLVSMWAEAIEGAVIDAGCGPGHWTNFLTKLALATRGVDLVPEFIERARSTYPAVPLTVGRLDDLDCGPGPVGGVLSWHLFIHHEPSTICIPLQDFSRVLGSGGMLLIGFFQGPIVKKFAHAAAPARWSASDLSNELKEVGFDIVESHLRKTNGQRPQAAIFARPRLAR